MPIAELSDHHDPVGRGDYISRQHVARYRFAVEQLGAISRPLRILDIASGAGYGTAALRARGHDVIGADAEAMTVGAARRRHGPGRWLVADARALPFPDRSFDAVVSFETLEHVVDGGALLDELRRVLIPGGRLICSTPNIRYTAHPAFHLKEYEPGEFFALIGERFSDVRRFGQYFRLRDRARDLYTWYLQRSVLRVADRSGVRPLWHRVRRTSRSRAGNAGDAPQQALAADRAHAVAALRGEQMLRIMVTVATRPEE